MQQQQDRQVFPIGPFISASTPPNIREEQVGNGGSERFMAPMSLVHHNGCRINAINTVLRKLNGHQQDTDQDGGPNTAIKDDCFDW